MGRSNIETLNEFVPPDTNIYTRVVCSLVNKLEPIPWPPLPRGPKYLRRTLYLDYRLASHLRDFAKSESWELADLARCMILVGLALRHLYEAESTVGSTKRLITAIDALKYFTHGTVRRRYSRRSGGQGVWMTVSLPAGFLKHVDTYASSHGRSRNDALTLFLQDGIFCYRFGYIQFLKGIMKHHEHERVRSTGPPQKQQEFKSAEKTNG